MLKVHLSSASGERVALFAWRSQVRSAIGTSTAGCLDTDPLAVEGEPVVAVVSVIDWAGNESAPSAPLSFRYGDTAAEGEGEGEGEDGDADDASCAQVPWLPASISSLAVARRRRREQGRQ